MSDLSIIIPWRGGCPHREASRGFVVRHLTRVFGHADVHLADDGGQTFSRGASIDEVVDRAPGEMILVCDADLLVPEAQLHHAVWTACEGEGLVVPFTEYRYLNRVASSILRDRDMAPHDWPELPADWSYGPSYGGCGVFSRAAHRRAGGHPGFRGWGMEDVAFHLACSTLVAPTRWLDGLAFHLWHPVDTTNHPGSPTLTRNVALLRRYEQAAGRPEAMSALVAELRHLHASGSVG